MDSTTITTISRANITTITRTYYYYITGAYIIMISLVGPANLDIVCLIFPYTSLPSKQQQLLVWNSKSSQVSVLTFG